MGEFSPPAGRRNGTGEGGEGGGTSGTSIVNVTRETMSPPGTKPREGRDLDRLFTLCRCVHRLSHGPRPRFENLAGIGNVYSKQGLFRSVTMLP